SYWRLYWLYRYSRPLPPHPLLGSQADRLAGECRLFEGCFICNSVLHDEWSICEIFPSPRLARSVVHRLRFQPHTESHGTDNSSCPLIDAGRSCSRYWYIDVVARAHYSFFNPLLLHHDEHSV